MALISEVFGDLPGSEGEVQGLLPQVRGMKSTVKVKGHTDSVSWPEFFAALS